MKNYIKADEWCIIEDGFHPDFNEITESLMSLGNGRMGQRGNLEEGYSGKTLLGNYVAGVYYPDKTRVGWWKNGYPEYFAKVLNAANWTRIDVEIDGAKLDLSHCKILNFKRILDMQHGTLERVCSVELADGKLLDIHSLRFCSLKDDEGAAIRYSITTKNFSGKISLLPCVDGDIKNKDSNYDEKFWDEVSRRTDNNEGYLELRTKKTGFHVLTSMKVELEKNGVSLQTEGMAVSLEKFVGTKYEVSVVSGDTITLKKFVCNLSSMNYPVETLQAESERYVRTITEKGFAQMLAEQHAAWEAKWRFMDIIIEGDSAAQQGIRFNIFHLCQTYTGEDERLNIGPKGFTGEKYGGSTYWDTEAYCIPFYLATAEQKVARNLLIYRWKQLNKAIENAQKLGFKAGAALYPMVTMNGEECHNEWEITFEEIHRNGAIAYAIYDYVSYTGDENYLVDYGMEVLVAIARFWTQRVNFSQDKQQYVMLGVTGPNEYENNVNNNWYTNYIARWCMNYAVEVCERVKVLSPEKYEALADKIYLQEEKEFAKCREIAGNMYFPESKELGIFLQQDGFLDKENVTVADLDASDRPLNQKWSWDRILRSVFIKQADVLQGLYFFEDDFDSETVRRNFDYYEPRTVHESSLSPCVHSILATQLGLHEKAYEMYMRTSRLDIDDYNNDTEDGLHITSMAGTWMSVVKGFGGVRVKNNQLHINPHCPEQWKSLSFKLRFREHLLDVSVKASSVKISNLGTEDIEVQLKNSSVKVKASQAIELAN